MKNFCHGNGTYCQLHRWLRIYPSKNLIVRLDPHEFRKHIGIEHYHSEKSTALAFSCREGRSR
jgi:hypothetical protein